MSQQLHVVRGQTVSSHKHGGLHNATTCLDPATDSPMKQAVFHPPWDSYCGAQGLDGCISTCLLSRSFQKQKQLWLNSTSNSMSSDRG